MGKNSISYNWRYQTIELHKFSGNPMYILGKNDDRKIFTTTFQIINHKQEYLNPDGTDRQSVTLLSYKLLAPCAITCIIFTTVPNSKDYLLTHVPSTYKKLACFNYLSIEHRNNDCTRNSCKICGKRHNTLLHVDHNKGTKIQTF